ncbi:MAG TPA: DUF5655 domain-containing protein [Candidatus Thermoplasmatota archaeon]|nr:DUF5655 domain-containing protein [Candidatus Thermoplasmatota archaeon]
MRSVSDFHSSLKPRAAEAFLALRALAVSLGPDVVEKAGSSTVTYLRRDKPFLHVQQAKSRLHVAFPAALGLQDPNGRLLRRGEDKYVAVEGPEGVDGHLQEFVRKAYSATPR